LLGIIRIITVHAEMLLFNIKLSHRNSQNVSDESISEQNSVPILTFTTRLCMTLYFNKKTSLQNTKMLTKHNNKGNLKMISKK